MNATVYSAKACPVCKGTFTPRRTGTPQIYCSATCKQKANDEKRASASREAACRTCGKPLQPATGSRPRQYCSDGCRTEGWRRRHAVINITCDQCGKIVRRPPTGVAHAAKNHFCSQACKGKWMTKNLRGETHPNWKGGAIKYLSAIIRNHARGRAWAIEVLAAAHGLCERCGNPADEAHHKREVEELLALILDPANGEALCKDCHIDHHRS